MAWTLSAHHKEWYRTCLMKVWICSLYRHENGYPSITTELYESLEAIKDAVQFFEARASLYGCLRYDAPTPHTHKHKSHRRIEQCFLCQLLVSCIEVSGDAPKVFGQIGGFTPQASGGPKIHASLDLPLPFVLVHGFSPCRISSPIHAVLAHAPFSALSSANINAFRDCVTKAENETETIDSKPPVTVVRESRRSAHALAVSDPTFRSEETAR